MSRNSGTAFFGVSRGETEESNPWEFWTAATIARVTQCPQAAVELNWPLIHAALTERGLASKNSQAAVIATCAIESASTFQPVREAFWLDEAWRKANLRYWPWYGRGFVQLTWEDAYRNGGAAIGVDLLSDPDAAMEPKNAAQLFAWFWASKDIQFAADQRNWALVRSKVQGADAGLPRLIAICNALLG